MQEIVYQKIQVVTDAIELLEEGLPLDEEILTELKKLGIDCEQFIRRFEIKTSG